MVTMPRKVRFQWWQHVDRSGMAVMNQFSAIHLRLGGLAYQQWLLEVIVSENHDQGWDQTWKLSGRIGWMVMTLVKMATAIDWVIGLNMDNWSWRHKVSERGNLYLIGVLKVCNTPQAWWTWICSELLHFVHALYFTCNLMRLAGWWWGCLSDTACLCHGSCWIPLQHLLFL